MIEPMFDCQYVPAVGVSQFMKSSKVWWDSVLMRALHDQQVPLLKRMLGVQLRHCQALRGLMSSDPRQPRVAWAHPL